MTQWKTVVRELSHTFIGWAIGGGLAQLIMLPFGIASVSVWVGVVLGATGQAIIEYKVRGSFLSDSIVAPNGNSH